MKNQKIKNIYFGPVARWPPPLHPTATHALPAPLQCWRLSPSNTTARDSSALRMSTSSSGGTSPITTWQHCVSPLHRLFQLFRQRISTSSPLLIDQQLACLIFPTRQLLNPSTCVLQKVIGSTTQRHLAQCEG